MKQKRRTTAPTAEQEWTVNDMTDCKCEFVYDELHGRIVCKKCFRVLTAEEKRELLEHANALRRAEEEAEKDG